MIPDGVMFNAYPDSCGADLSAAVRMLTRAEFEGVFRYFYILPSMFRSDLDRGFSVISYDLDEAMATSGDLAALTKMGLELKLDFVLNHLSVASPQFRDMLEKGDESPHVDTFIDWNKFWEGRGTMGPEGFIIPDEPFLSKLFMRKPGLPILRVPFPDGTDRFYWNTFYQSVMVTPPTAADLAGEGGASGVPGLDKAAAAEVADIVRRAVETGTALREADFGEFGAHRETVAAWVDRNCTEFRGQMDLNAASPQAWTFYGDVFARMAAYGARIVRLDAFAYLHKEAGKSNFFNEPGTWDYLERIRTIADSYGIVLLPEIHSKYEDGTHEKLAERGYPFYDFFFPALVIDAVESGNGTRLAAWAREIRRRGFSTVNMLGCHDGIPVLDVKGILDEGVIDGMIELITSRGGRVKDLYGADGKRISYYQVNATFFSALGADETALLLARALQIFMPGVPEVWYLDLFAGENDIAAADERGHKEINRTNLTEADIEAGLKRPIVQKQLALLRFRNSFGAFGPDADFSVDAGETGRLKLTWSRDGAAAELEADLKAREFRIAVREDGAERELALG